MNFLGELILRALVTVLVGKGLTRAVDYVTSRPFLHHYYLGHKGRPTKCLICS